MRIGIFGGTFDPPHLGHKKYACEIINKLRLDRLIVIPTCVPPHKSSEKTASGEDRLEMVRLCFKEIDKIEVSDDEIRRGGKSYTVDTVASLSAQYPNDELIFIMGSDMLLSFHTWKKPLDIINKVKICGVTRLGSLDRSRLENYVDEYFPTEKARFIIEDFSPIEISSTQVRNAVKNGENTDGLIEKEVYEYIKKKELYH
ncbi:MAG: nicotinate (nicotinamide) nucleotide adenylyltransferase [Clostridia bacterium]|nr:nicotinate (nicotinamide) nucleotide adenylyltransferase [Clostridia bacterium]